MALKFLKDIGQAFVPKKLRPNLRNYLLTAGIEEVPFKFFGGLFFTMIFITIISYFTQVHQRVLLQMGETLTQVQRTLIIGGVSFAYIFLLALLGSMVIILIIYFYLNIKIYNRTKALEDKLVDYLTLVSTNLKGGLSFEKSLWLSLKPDFGILAKEIGLVSKKVMTGNDLTEAMIEFSMKYDSPILKRSVNLIIGEIESGGHIVAVIDKVIQNLRKTKMLKDEMAASTVTYMIFIGAIVMVISPALFALSGQLLQIIIAFAAKIGGSMNAGGAGGVLPISIEEIHVDPAEFNRFSLMAIGSISISSAFIISIIEKGNMRAGVRYVPMFLAVSIVIFEILSWALTFLFGKFVTV